MARDIFTNLSVNVFEGSDDRIINLNLVVGRWLVLLDKLADQVDSGLDTLRGTSQSDDALVRRSRLGISDADVGSALGAKVTNDTASLADDATGTDSRDGDFLGGRSSRGSLRGGQAVWE